MFILTKIILTFKTISNVHLVLLDFLKLTHRDILYMIRGKRIKKIIARGATNDYKEIAVIMSGCHYRLDILPPLKNPVIFDIGGHIGSFSLFAFEYYRSSEPSIFIFEPDSGNSEYLKRNMEVNHIATDKYVLYNYAIGNYDGMAKLDKSKENDGYHITNNPKGKYMSCQIRTLSSVVSEKGIKNIDILKLNIEGGEYVIFDHRPSLEFIINGVFLIIMTCHSTEDKKDKGWVKERLRGHFDLIFEKEDFLIFKNKVIVAIESRKQEEMELHNRLRGQDIKYDSRRGFLISNKKFYAVNHLSTAYFKDWLISRCFKKVVLDYCCGDGRDAIFAAKNGAQSIGIDISDISIKNCEKNAAREGVSESASFFVMDAENLDFSESYFDIIICSGVLHHLDIDKAFAELARVLKPGGEVICIEPLIYNPFIQCYRKMTPHLRTKWETEHILSKKDLAVTKKYFDMMQIRFYHLFVIFAVPFRNYKIFNWILAILEKIDSLVLKLPGLKWWSWQIIFILNRPKK